MVSNNEHFSGSESTVTSASLHEQATYTRQLQAPFQPLTPSWLRKKPLWVVMREIEYSHNPHQASPSSSPGHQQQRIQRHLSLLDLISVGVGGTIGSGIFVLAGFIAHNYAGPATAISFAIAGIAAAASGVCYAELSGRIPSAGSTYVYSYVCMGEIAAVIAASCLTLEYGVSGAAVARSWGDKVVAWLRDQWHWENVEAYLEPHGINLMAGVVSTVSVLLLLGGVHESKQVTNFFTLTKIALVIFMTCGGIFLFQLSNIRSETTSFAPYGTAGILRGATSSFFGYLGYDEVCCIAGEAMHPQRDMPRAVLWTLFIVTVLYISASMALTGMVTYDQISGTSGFPAAFHDRGASWAANICAAGEVFTLPVVVLISLMAQPRLQLAMAQDGLLPPIFSQVDETGNLKWGTFLSGAAMVVVATFVPFGYLDDLISVGILLAFSMTNSCLILLRCESPVQRPQLVEKHLVLLNLLSLMTGLLYSHAWTLAVGPFLTAVSLIATICVIVSLSVKCPRSVKFGGSVLRRSDSHPNILGGSAIGSGISGEEYFQTPLVPYLPCAGILINWCLVAQLELFGLFLLFLYIGITVCIYMVYCSGSSFGDSLRWKRGSYQSLAGLEDDPDHWPMLQREFSLPPVKALSVNNVTAASTATTRPAKAIGENGTFT